MRTPISWLHHSRWTKVHLAYECQGGLWRLECGATFDEASKRPFVMGEEASKKNAEDCVQCRKDASHRP